MVCNYLVSNLQCSPPYNLPITFGHLVHVILQTYSVYFTCDYFNKSDSVCSGSQVRLPAYPIRSVSHNFNPQDQNCITVYQTVNRTSHDKDPVNPNPNSVQLPNGPSYQTLSASRNSAIYNTLHLSTGQLTTVYQQLNPSTNQGDLGYTSLNR